MNVENPLHPLLLRYESYLGRKTRIPPCTLFRAIPCTYTAQKIHQFKSKKSPVEPSTVFGQPDVTYQVQKLRHGSILKRPCEPATVSGEIILECFNSQIKINKAHSCYFHCPSNSINVGLQHVYMMSHGIIHTGDTVTLPCELANQPAFKMISLI
jgi:hypothetical protein